MNFLAVISFIIAAVVFVSAMLTSSKEPGRFLDFHGMLIVIGGTLASTAISFQLDRILTMLKVFWARTILGRKPDFVATIRLLAEIAELYRTESSALKAKVESCSDPFLKEGMLLLMDELVDVDELETILDNRINTIFHRYSVDADRFKAMGKYPPAMGLMGAVLGMIGLLGGLGQAGAEKTVGPAMSIALVATLYGIALANLIIIPVGENLSDASKEIKLKNRIILEGIKLIHEKKTPAILYEHLNSYLLPTERISRKK